MTIATTKLGQSALTVSKICLGTMTFGEQNTEPEAHAQLDYAVAHGVNFIDTAEMYPVRPSERTYTLTEQYIGTWLKQQPRDRVILATKVAGPSRGMPWIRDGKLDARNIALAVEASLKRLQTDYIDLYQVHWPARNVPIFGQTSFDPSLERESAPILEQLEALDRLVRDGKVRAIGVSNETPWGVSQWVQLAQQHGLARVATIQNPYHLMNRSFESGLDETCFHEKVSLLAYSPLAFGRLTGKYDDDINANGRLNIFGLDWSPRYSRPRALAATKRYVDLARAHGLTPTQLALAWCYSRWFVASTIIGATTLEQLQHNIAAYQVTPLDDVLKQVETIHQELMNPAQ